MSEATTLKGTILQGIGGFYYALDGEGVGLQIVPAAVGKLLGAQFGRNGGADILYDALTQGGIILAGEKKFQRGAQVAEFRQRVHG